MGKWKHVMLSLERLSLNPKSERFFFVMKFPDPLRLYSSLCGQQIHSVSTYGAVNPYILLCPSPEQLAFCALYQQALRMVDQKVHQ